MGCINSKEYEILDSKKPSKVIPTKGFSVNKVLLKNFESESKSNIITETELSKWIKNNNGIKSSVNISDIIVLPNKQKEEVKKLLEKSFIRHIFMESFNTQEIYCQMYKILDICK